MKPIYFLPFLSLLLLAPASGNAAGSMLRISCEGDDVGAEVLINGKFRGECPIDMQVPEGQLKLLVRKKVDAQREKVFEQEIRMGEGTIKKVEVRLGRPQLNSELMEAGKTIIKKAEAGGPDAMHSLSKAYQVGSFVPEDAEKALMWLRKAADAGNIEAMTDLGVQYIYRNPGDDPARVKEGLAWIRKAADLGSANAMFTLGSLYGNSYGKKIPKDEAQAILWWRKAASMNHTYAIDELKKRGLR